MKRILLALLLTFAFAAPSFGAATGPRDVQPEILAMFRAQVKDLTDFDPGLCGTDGIFGLISTDGEWTCEIPAEPLDPDDFLQHAGNVNDMTRAICGHNSALDNCTTFNWYIDTLGGGQFETVLSDKFGLGAQHLDTMDFGTVGKTVEYYYFAADGGIVTLDGNVLAEKGTVGAPAYSFTGKPDTGMWLNEIGDNLDFSIDGVSIINLQPALMRISQPIWQIYGTVDKPSYTFHDDPDTGMYAPYAGAIDFAAAGVMRLRIGTGTVTATVPFRAQDGIQGTPAYSFTSDPNTGMYRLSDGTIRFASNNVAKLEIKATDVKVFDNLLITDGLEGSPGLAFSSDPDTGIYPAGIGYLRFATAGSVAMTLNSVGSMYLTGKINASGGAASVASYAFNSDANTGMYSPGADQVTLAAGGKDVVSVFTCVDLYDTGGPPETSGSPNRFCDSDGTTFAKTTNIAGTLTFSDTNYSTQSGNLAVEYGPTPGLGFYFNGTIMMFTANNGSSRLRIGPTQVRAYAPWSNINGTAALPSYTWTTDSTTGLYYTTDEINLSVAATKVASFTPTGLTLAGGITVGTDVDMDWVFTAPSQFRITLNNTSQTGVSPFSLVANNLGTGASTDAFTLFMDNEGSGGSMDGLVIIAKASTVDAAYSYAIRVEHQEDVGAMYAGLDIRGTSTGTISYALKVDDPEINYAISIGDNRILTSYGIIESAELSVLIDAVPADYLAVFGGSDSSANAQHTHSDLLWKTEIAIFSSDAGLCIGVDRYGSTDIASCNNGNGYQLYIDTDATITDARIVQVYAGDVGSECRITITDTGGTAYAGAPVVEWDSGTVGNFSTISDTTSWTVSEGDWLEFVVTNRGGAACTGTRDPYVRLELHGTKTY